MMDLNLKSMRAKARALASMIGKSEEAAMSLLRRLDAHKSEIVNTQTGEVTSISL